MRLIVPIVAMMAASPAATQSSSSVDVEQVGSGSAAAIAASTGSLPARSTGSVVPPTTPAMPVPRETGAATFANVVSMTSAPQATDRSFVILGSGAQYLAVQQNGSNNAIDIAQQGANNYASLDQAGNNNLMRATQFGNNNSLTWSQVGDGLSKIGVTQSGNESIAISQRGVR